METHWAEVELICVGKQYKEEALMEYFAQAAANVTW